MAKVCKISALIFLGMCTFLFAVFSSRGRTSDPCPAVSFTVFSDPRTSFRENLGLFVEQAACRSGRKAKVVEVGVWRGDFAELLLERYHESISEYVMIEPAEKLTGQQTAELSARLKKFPAKYPTVKFSLVNEVSSIAGQQYPNHYFDWIYIDGLHTFRGVETDVELFWEKLRPGGLFSGHDFSMSRKQAKNDPWNTVAPWSGMRDGVEKAGFPGSYKAVVMHARKHALQVFHTLEGRCGQAMWSLKDTGEVFRNNPSWFMFKPVDFGVHKPTLGYKYQKGFGPEVFSSF